MPIVKVISDPQSGQRSGDWKVEVGARTVSRHRQKSQAISKAKQKARAKGGQVRIQNKQGQFRQGPSYE